MKKTLIRILVLALSVLMLVPIATMASSVPEGETCYITVTIVEDSGSARVSDSSSKYLTGVSPLAVEVVSLIQKNYDKLYAFRSPAMKDIMDQGLVAFRTSDEAWKQYVDLYFEDVSGGDLKSIVREKTSTLGDLEPNVDLKMIFKNEVAGDAKYGTTYTVTIRLTVEGVEISNDPTKNGVGELLTLEHIVYMSGDAAGTFRPNDSITRKEVAQIFYNLLQDKNVPAPQAFEDVPANEWYAKAVNTIANLGILNGDGKGHFFPNDEITRAQFVTIAAQFAQAVDAEIDFTDVAENHWARNFIKTAVAYGWVSGYDEPDGTKTFRPDNPITRAEAVQIVNSMLWRYADRAYVDANLENLKRFPDVKKSDWAYYQIFEATNAHAYERTGLKDEIWNP